MVHISGYDGKCYMMVFLQTLGFCFFPLLLQVRSWGMRMYGKHGVYVLVHWETFSFSEPIPPFVSSWLRMCLHVSCYIPCWLGMISSSGWLLDCPCVFKGLYPLLCVCFELVYARGDSLDESKLLFWNKLDQCDLEPETCVVILAECCRWPLQQRVLQVESNAPGSFMLSGCVPSQCYIWSWISAGSHVSE